MGFRSFRFNCTFRVILLIGTILLFAWLLTRTQYVTLFICGLLIAYQICSLVRYVEFTNRNLDLFLQSIEFSDFSQRLNPSPAGKSFSDLKTTFENVLEKFREISATREENLRYLHSIVQNVGIGVMAFDDQGDMVLLNSAAKALLGPPALRNIDDLASSSPELHGKLRALQPGQRELVTVPRQGQLMQLSLNATELRRHRQIITIVSIQNISLELNEKEMDSWRNLIRVLTHEIKNSLTPIASLATSVEQLVVPEYRESDQDSFSSVTEIRDALQIIQKRSEGLLQFVDTYRDLTHIPQPEFMVLTVRDLFRRMEKLVAPQIEGMSIHFGTAIHPENMMLTADPKLIEQVLINLLLNAFQATEGQARVEIFLKARIDARSRPVIHVLDNGPGIVKESLEKIFVPFYSTRKEGSGIGLSLSRQIMRLHRGDLTVHSQPGVRTVFTMQF